MKAAFLVTQAPSVIPCLQRSLGSGHAEGPRAETPLGSFTKLITSITPSSAHMLAFTSRTAKTLHHFTSLT